MKSNLNYGGLSERALRLDVNNRPSADNSSDQPAYSIVSRKEISPDIWDSPDYIVEHYINNSSDFFYRIHLLRNHLVVSRVIDTAPIKKFPAGVVRDDWHYLIPTGEFVKTVAGVSDPTRLVDDVLRFCRSMLLEFGALDVVQDDEGAFYLIDVNTTPWWGEPESCDLEMIAFLASGLE